MLILNICKELFHCLSSAEGAVVVLRLKEISTGGLVLPIPALSLLLWPSFMKRTGS